MAMGNPLSPLLSGLYMEFFERKYLPEILPRNVLWVRYVDDIFCAWPVNKSVNSFLERLNSFVPSIKFTVEKEENGKLPFLDIMVHRTDRTLKFAVYRKPTNICSYIHFYSNHSNKTKTAVISSMFLRALRVCCPEFLDEELDMIRKIAGNLRYPNYFIENAFSKAKKTFYGITRTKEFEKNNLLVLPFYPCFINIPRFVKPLGINVVFKTLGTIRNMLIKNSPHHISGCIYEIPCKQCNKRYIGQSGKSLEVRLKQHKYNVRTGNMQNALFIHMNDSNHGINWAMSKEIIFCKEIVKRNLIESCIIQRDCDKLLNISQGLYKMDEFLLNSILKQVGLFK